MGDPSSLRLVPADSASIPIDWSRVPEAMKKFFLEGWGYDWETEEERPSFASTGDKITKLTYRLLPVHQDVICWNNETA
jgi:hypothetical protein